MKSVTLSAKVRTGKQEGIQDGKSVKKYCSNFNHIVKTNKGVFYQLLKFPWDNKSKPFYYQCIDGKAKIKLRKIEYINNKLSER